MPPIVLVLVGEQMLFCFRVVLLSVGCGDGTVLCQNFRTVFLLRAPVT